METNPPKPQEDDDDEVLRIVDEAHALLTSAEHSIFIKSLACLLSRLLTERYRKNGLACYMQDEKAVAVILEYIQKTVGFYEKRKDVYRDLIKSTPDGDEQKTHASEEA
jgi:hypothetical protein